MKISIGFSPHSCCGAEFSTLNVIPNELEIKVVGEVDPVTGYVLDLKLLSDLVNEKVLERFDHKNLNLDTEEFKELNPTAENIAVVIYDLLRPHIKPEQDLFIRLFETPRNFVEYPA